MGKEREKMKRRQEIEFIVSELQKCEELAGISTDILRPAIERAMKRVRSEKFLERQKRRRY